jgi:hypothetical protein
LLSIVVVAYNMRREAPRTLLSLCPPYQQGVGVDEYEVLVVDNGSTEPLDGPELESLSPNIRYHYLDPASRSPAPAVNVGVAMTEGSLVGIILDGARLVTPGLVRHALLGLSLFARPIVTPLAWHLGPARQRTSIRRGYDQSVEDRLLDEIGWPGDGYRLFEVAALAASNHDGLFSPMAESPCLFLPRSMFGELGGYEERFDLPGGGLANLDMFVRACEAPNSDLVVLLGEGSFHQVHGGASTNSPAEQWNAAHEQYVKLRGRRFSRPVKGRTYIGTVPRPALATLEESARNARLAPVGSPRLRATARRSHEVVARMTEILASRDGRRSGPSRA